MTARELDELSINTIRILSADAVQAANSGHPGMPMGAAAMAYTLWSKYLRHNPADPGWWDRDRFVLSAGHGSMLLYSLLHLAGYDLPLDELKRFRQWGSKTPGHPERGHTPGVEVATGPLGQGLSNAVGMAIAEAWLAARFNKPGHTVVDHHTYVICGDGDLMEGVTQEAASLAGHLQLGKLICLYDQNHISLAGATSLCFTEDVAGRFTAYGWHAVQVMDGNDVAEIARAIDAARAETTRPSLILVRTHIGFGSPKKQDTFGAHGSPLGEEELAATKKALGWPTMDKFYLPEAAVANFRTALVRGESEEAEWKQRLAAYRAAFPAEAAALERAMLGQLPEAWDAEIPVWKPADKALATRVAGGEVMNAIARRVGNLVGGSADLNPSTNTALKGGGDFQPVGVGAGAPGAVGGEWGHGGRNIAFGVREHAMGAAINGMAAHGGVIPFGATFMVFSDYVKPSVRIAALSQLHCVYVFTHDSIAVGEDGPTHEPVEQLAGLRSIPGLTVLRPADANETADAWRFAMTHNGPTAMILTRQNVPHLDRSQAQGGLDRGAYVVAEPADGRQPEVILIATGSEVSLCVAAQEALAGKGVAARVVSMPSWELFAKQDTAWQEQVLPQGIRKRVTVEAGSTMGWHRWAADGVVLGIDRFGASAPGEIVMKELGFTVERVVEAALGLAGR